MMLFMERLKMEDQVDVNDARLTHLAKHDNSYVRFPAGRPLWDPEPAEHVLANFQQSAWSEQYAGQPPLPEQSLPGRLNRA